MLCEQARSQTPICPSCIPKVDLGITRCSKCFSTTSTLNSYSVCELCNKVPTPFEKIRYLWEYDLDAVKIIRIMKYKPSASICRQVARILAESFAKEIVDDQYDFILPMPCTNSSLNKRGFNQSIILAKEISNRTKTQIKRTLLKTSSRRVAQASLAQKERIRNVRSAFYVNTDRLMNKKLLLVDDVVTTGATATSAAMCLMQAGAASVSLITLSRAQSWGGFRWSIEKKLVSVYKDRNTHRRLNESSHKI